MSRFEWLQIGNKKVLKQDFSNLSGELLKEVLHESHETIKNKGYTNIVVITNIKDLKFDRQITKAFEELSEKNKPFVKESAIYGAGTLQKVAIESVGRLTGRHYNIFREEEDAKQWINQL